MEEFIRLEVNSHGFEKDFGLGSGERVRVIVLEDEGGMMMKKRKRIEEKKIDAIVMDFVFGCENFERIHGM